MTRSVSTPPQATDPTPYDDPSWDRKHSTALLVGVVVVVVGAVAIFAFDLGSDTAAPGNIAVAGVMQLDDAEDGKAVLVAEDLAPGAEADGYVKIANVGDAAG